MQRIAPGMAVGMLVYGDVQMRQIGERGAAELDIDPAAADHDGEAIGPLQPPPGGHARAFVSSLVEQRPDRIRRFVAEYPCERCRTIEDQAHGRPSSR